ncbi:unnamed protein product, partial [Rotaria sp. Silwood2]
DRWNNNDELSNSTKTKDFVSENYSLDKRVQTTHWPTSTQSSSSMIFDPFASLETSPNHFQPNLFSSNQQQTFTNSSIFQQQSNINSMNNTWSSAAGKLDISLNNLIPHTRGDQQKTSLTLNQLTSSTKSDFSILNTNTQSIFSTPNKKNNKILSFFFKFFVLLMND